MNEENNIEEDEEVKIDEKCPICGKFVYMSVTGLRCLNCRWWENEKKVNEQRKLK